MTTKFLIFYALTLLFTLEIVALFLGFNGQILRLSIGAICSLGGALITKIVIERKNKNDNL